MKLFLISQTENTDYDTFDSAVVCAPDEATARGMDPGSGEPIAKQDWVSRWSAWCSSPDAVKVTYLGEAAETIPKGVVCSSFNAG